MGTLRRTPVSGATCLWSVKVTEEALNLADDLANINKAKNMWHFDEAAKHLRELAKRIKELEEQIDKLERSK